MNRITFTTFYIIEKIKRKIKTKKYKKRNSGFMY
jgi:hypothetical protein